MPNTSPRVWGTAFGSSEHSRGGCFTVARRSRRCSGQQRLFHHIVSLIVVSAVSTPHPRSIALRWCSCSSDVAISGDPACRLLILTQETRLRLRSQTAPIDKAVASEDSETALQSCLAWKKDGDVDHRALWLLCQRIASRLSPV